MSPRTDWGCRFAPPPASATDPEAQAAFAALDLDAAVVAAYGLILPQAMLDAPRRGCLNIHASLLPRWRGAAPIQAAILAGDTETGITIMQMEAGLDTGPMLLRQSVPITPRDHDGQPARHACGDGCQPDPARPHLLTLAPSRRPEADATYAPKLSRDDGRIDWSKSAEIHRPPDPRLRPVARHVHQPRRQSIENPRRQSLPTGQAPPEPSSTPP